MVDRRGFLKGSAAAVAVGAAGGGVLDACATAPQPGVVSPYGPAGDAGIDQSFLNGRVVMSVTGFSNTFNNLINFAGIPSHYQLIVQGAAIIVAVSVNLQRKRGAA